MRSDPSLGQVLALFMSSVGLGYTIYGKKQAHAVALGCGVLLMVVPYVVSNVAALLIVALTLMVLPFVLHRFLA
jgi:hypothetical protein